MDCSTPGLPVLHCLPEFVQTHVHWVSDVIQPSHPLSPFSSCPHLFPASGSFPMNQLFTSGDQIGASALVLSMNIQGWFPLGLTGWISLQSKGLSRVFSSTTVQSITSTFNLLYVQLSHLFMTTGRTIALTIRTFVSKVMSLLCNTLTRFVITSLPRSKHLLISWLQSPSTLILGPRNEIWTVFTFPPSFAMKG